MDGWTERSGMKWIQMGDHFKWRSRPTQDSKHTIVPSWLVTVLTDWGGNSTPLNSSVGG